MKVTIINNSDSKGGAAIASFRMLTSLRRLGVDARMLVMHKGTDSLCVQELQPAYRRRACFLWEHLDIYLHNGFSKDKLFKASIANCGMPVHKHPWVVDADYVMLGWVNQGMLSLSDISKIKAPVAWVMHDMWNLTGACHHAEKCEKYKTTCDDCRLFKGSDLSCKQVHDLSWQTWMRKKGLYAKKDITFIAVSSWLAQKCRESALMQNQRVEVIPNAFLVEDFVVDHKSSASVPKIVMGAARLDDPIKGLPYAIEALNILADKGVKAEAVFFGALKDADALVGLRLPYKHLGPISNKEEIRSIYSQADVVLSSSLYETLPTTLIEGMAAQCVPVTFGQGGQADIVDHLSTGYIAAFPDTNDLANGLMWALGGNVDKARLPIVVGKRFSSDAIARKVLLLLQN